MTPSTVADLFAGAGAGTGVDRLVSAALSRRAGMSEHAEGLLRSRIDDAVAGLLDIDLGACVLDAWSAYAELRTAAQRSLEPPGVDQPVRLHSHRITSSHRPRVELWVDGSLVAVLDLVLEVYADVHTLDALVRGGRLVAVGAGDVDVGASLSVDGGPPLERTATCPIGMLLRLGDGVPLVGDAPPAPDRRGHTAAADAGRPGLRSAVLAGLVVVVLAAAGVLAVAVPASAWPWAAPGVAGVVEPSSAWNMRAGPSATTAVLGVAQPGQSVAVECLDNGWARLVEPRAGAFVDRRGLRLESQPPGCP